MNFKNLEELKREIDKREQEGNELETLRRELKAVTNFRRMLVKEIGD